MAEAKHLPTSISTFPNNDVIYEVAQNPKMLKNQLLEEGAAIARLGVINL